MKKENIKRLLIGLVACLLFWIAYCVCVHLGANWIFWVYLGLFAVSAIVYVGATRGNLSRLPEETPLGWRPDAYAAYRERIEGARKRVFWLPLVTVGTTFSFVLDAINLFFLDGLFL